MTTGQGQVAAQPVVHPARPVVAVVAAPPPRPVVVRPVTAEVILPEANDVYISTAAINDIVFVNGSTYIWITGADGRRHRHFYAHGDRRQEVFRRRENLRSVNAHRAAQPPKRYAHQGDRHEWKDTRHNPHATHVATMSGHHESPQHRPALNAQARRPDQPRQASRNPSQPMRETAAHDAARHHVEPGSPAAKT